MTILTLLAALLLSGSSYFTVHTNEVSSGGPTTAKPTQAPPGMTVNEVIGGGPIS